MKKVFLLGLVFLVLLSSAFGASASDVKEPDLYLKFEDNLNDLMGNFTLSGSATSYSSAYPTYGTSGDGSNKSYNSGTSTNQFGYLTSFSPQQTFAVAVWLKDTASSGDLWSADPETGTTDRLARVGFSGNNIQGLTFSGSTPYFTTVGSTNVLDGNWHHICAIVDGRDMKIYVDGVLDASSGASGTINSGTTNLVIGGRKVGGTGSGLNMDEMYYSQGSFTADNCLALYEYGYPAESPAPEVDVFLMTAEDADDLSTLKEFSAYTNFEGSTFYARTTNTSIIFNESYDLSGNNGTLSTNTGANYSNGGFIFEGNSKLASSVAPVTGSTERTVIVAFNTSDVSSTQDGALVGWGDRTGPKEFTVRLENGKPQVQWGNGNLVGGTTYTADAVQTLALTYSGTNISLYANGAYDGSSTVSLNTGTDYNLTLGERIGSSPSLNLDNTKMLWVKVYDTALTSSELSAELEESVQRTSDLVAYYPFQRIESGLANFNVTAPNYYYSNFTSYNVSANLQANLTGFPLEEFDLLTPNATVTNATEFNITWTEANSPTGKSVSYNVSVLFTDNSSRFESFTTSNLYYNLDISAYSVENYTINVTATEASTSIKKSDASTMVVNRLNYLYFFNEKTQEVIEGANISINMPNLATDLELVTDSQGKVSFESIQNNTLQLGNYSITFTDFIGYVTPITFNREYNSLPVNKSFNITVTNFNISIFYRSNFTAFTKEATVIIEGISEYTTSNGSVFIQNETIASGEYRLTVSADNYFNEEKTFTYNGQEAIEVNLYMLELNNSNSGTVTIRAVDEFNRIVSDAEVNMLEYDSSILSYIEVSECYTDSNGECKFLVETNTKSYQFTANKEVNGLTISTSTKPEIFEDDITGGQVVVFSEVTKTIILSSFVQYDINPTQNIISSIDESFNNVTNQSNIDVSFRSIDGTTLEVCVEYFELVGGIETSLTGDTFCVTASSAEVTENAFFTLNMSKDYLAKVYIKTNNGNAMLETFRYYGTFSFEDLLKRNYILPFFVLFIWIFLIGGGLMLKNVPLTGVFIIIGAWVIAFVFPSIGVGSVSVLQSLLGILLIYNGRKKEDFQ